MKFRKLMRLGLGRKSPKNVESPDFRRPLMSDGFIKCLAFSVSMHVFAALAVNSSPRSKLERLTVQDYVDDTLQGGRHVFFNPEALGTSVERDAQKSNDLFNSKYVPKLLAEFSEAFAAEQVSAGVLRDFLLRRVEYAQRIKYENMQVPENQIEEIVFEQMLQLKSFLEKRSDQISKTPDYNSRLLQIPNLLEEIPYEASNAEVLNYYFQNESNPVKGLNCEGRAMLMGILSTMVMQDDAEYAMHVSLQNQRNDNGDVIASVPHVALAIKQKGTDDWFDVDQFFPSALGSNQRGMVYGRDWLKSVSEIVPNKTTSFDDSLQVPITNSVGGFKVDTMDANQFTVKDSFDGLNDQQKIRAAFLIMDELLQQGYSNIVFKNLKVNGVPNVSFENYEKFLESTEGVLEHVMVDFRLELMDLGPDRSPIYVTTYGRVLWNFEQLSDYGEFVPGLAKIVSSVNNAVVHKDFLDPSLNLENKVYLIDWSGFGDYDYGRVQRFLDGNSRMETFGVDNVGPRISSLDFSKLQGFVSWYDDEYYDINAREVRYTVDFYNKFKGQIDKIRLCKKADNVMYCKLKR